MADITRDQYSESKLVEKKIFQKFTDAVDADFNEQVDIYRTRQMRILSALVEHEDKRFGDGFKVVENEIDNTNRVILKAGMCAVHIETGKAIPLRIASDLEITGWTTPSGGDRTDYLYLDVWFEEVDSLDDPNLINPAVGEESAVDYRLFWQFGKSEGSAPGTPPTGHTYITLAQIARQNGDAAIVADDITNGLDDIHTIRGYFEVLNDLTVGGDLSIGGNLDTSGTLDIAGKLTVDDDADITGSLDVDGTANIQGDLTCQDDILMSSGKTIDGVDVSLLNSTFTAFRDAYREQLFVLAGVSDHETAGSAPDPMRLIESSTTYVPKVSLMFEKTDYTNTICAKFHVEYGTLVGWYQLTVDGVGSDEISVGSAGGEGYKELTVDISGQANGRYKITFDMKVNAGGTDNYVSGLRIYATYL
jgi:cytoskeletal protein CcmA (bactofilin family)